MSKNDISKSNVLVIIIFGFIIISLLVFCTGPSEVELKEQKLLEENKLYLNQSKEKEKAERDSLSKIPMSTMVNEVYSMVKENVESRPYMKIQISNLIKLAPQSKFVKNLNKSYDSLSKLQTIDEQNLANQNRADLQPELRNIFLDAGLDIEVKITGKKNDHLILTYILFNDVWLRKFQKEGWINILHNKGFNKITMKDGYSYEKYYTWE